MSTRNIPKDTTTTASTSSTGTLLSKMKYDGKNVSDLVSQLPDYRDILSKINYQDVVSKYQQTVSDAMDKLPEFQNALTQMIGKLPKNRQQAEKYYNDLSKKEKRDVVIFTTASISLLAFVVIWWQKRRRRNQYQLQRPMSKSIVSENAKHVDVETWQEFEEFAFQIRTNDNVQQKLTDGDKLMLYGLYKQIVVGDAPDDMEITTWNIVVEHAKHDAWERMKGMPIDIAIQNYVTAAKYFLDGSEDMDGGDNNRPNHHHDATGGLGPMTVSRPVVESGTYFDTNTPQGQFLLAACHNDVHKMEQLLKDEKQQNSKQDTSWSIDSVDDAGQSALHLAADKGCNDAVEFLLQNNANIHIADMDGISVLQAAVIAGHVDTCQILLKYGANPDQEDHDGDTPRSCAEDEEDDDEENGNARAMKELFSNLDAMPPITAVITSAPVSPLQ